MSFTVRPLAVVVFALALGCMAPPPPGASDPSAEPADGPLLTTVTVTTSAGDSVGFALQVTNAADAAVPLEYSSGQSFDFIVSRGTQEVWRWSADRMFTQALRMETLAPGETVSHEAVWVPGVGAAGEYRVRGVLTARNVRAEQTVPFRIE